MTDHNLLKSGPVPRLLLLLLAPLALIEAVLSLSELVDFGSLRSDLILFLGLWPQLWQGGAAFYPGQGAVMLLTYSLVHGDLVHLAFNALGLLLFGRVLLGWMSTAEFLAALGASIAMGAVFYQVLSQGNAPAVGMSGGVYGLGALWAAGIMRQRSREIGTVRPVIGVLGAAFAITVLAPFATGGNVAWQAHLGGAVLGLIWGCCRRPKTHRKAGSHLKAVRK